MSKPIKVNEGQYHCSANLKDFVADGICRDCGEKLNFKQSVKHISSWFADCSNCGLGYEIRTTRIDVFIRKDA